MKSEFLIFDLNQTSKSEFCLLLCATVTEICLLLCATNTQYPNRLHPLPKLLTIHLRAHISHS